MPQLTDAHAVGIDVVRADVFGEGEQQRVLFGGV
jgi:hypothetical protein